MCGLYASTQRAGRGIAYLANLIGATIRTRWNFARTVELNIRRKIVRIMEGCTIGRHLMFQGELIDGGVNLPKVVDAGVSAGSGTCFD